MTIRTNVPAAWRPSGTLRGLVRFRLMNTDYFAELARQMIAEQGDEAGEHLAEAIRALRAVGDRRGARLLMKIAQNVEQVDQGASYSMPRRNVIRRH